MHDRGWYLADPGVLTARARVSRLPVAVHDGLQDGGERSHAYPGGYEDRVLRSEDMTGRSSVRSIQVNLMSRLFRSYSVTWSTTVTICLTRLKSAMLSPDRDSYPHEAECGRHSRGLE